MKLQKNVAICSGVVSLFALCLSYVFNSRNDVYISGIFVGLFSSGILICVVSIITYYNEREKALYSLYCGCYDFMEALNSNLRPNKQVPVEDIRKSFENMMNVYDKSVYYYMCQLSIITKNTKLWQITMDIWESVRHIYLFVADDRSNLTKFYLGDITKEELENKGWKYTSEESIAYIKALQGALDKLAFHMNYYNIRKEKKGVVSSNAD